MVARSPLKRITAARVGDSVRDIRQAEGGLVQLQPAIDLGRSKIAAHRRVEHHCAFGPNILVEVPQNAQPDATVGAHIERVRFAEAPPFRSARCPYRVR